MKLFLALCLGLAVFFFTKAAQAQTQTYDTSRSFTVFEKRGSGYQVRTFNAILLVDSRLHWGADEPTQIVVELETDTTRRSDAEGFLKDSVTATAWRIDGAAKRTPLWSLREPGDMGEIEHDQPLFIVRQPGCCGARNSFATFALDNGRRLFTATGERASECWATLEIPNSHGVYRYIALHAAYSATDDTFGSRKETVGLLTYAAPDRPLARYRLLAKDQAGVDVFMGEATVRLVADGKPEETDSLTLWSADHRADPAAIGGYSIKVNLSPGNTVIIPVKADKLDLAHASLPAGLTIEPTSLP
jgi:hypothetical protein